MPGRVIDAQDAHETQEVVDTDFVSFFTGRFAQAIDLVPEDLRLMSEDELYAKTNPTANDWKLRQNFSDLIKEARTLGQEHIKTTRVYEGIITRQTFHDLIMPNPVKMAWIIRPIIEYTDYYNAIHKVALDKIFRMVKNMPEDTKYLPQLLKIAETAGNRVHGPVVQRMQIHSRNLNVEMDAKQLPGGSDANQDEMQKKIEALQAKLIEAPKDVTPSDDEN